MNVCVGKVVLWVAYGIFTFGIGLTNAMNVCVGKRGYTLAAAQSKLADSVFPLPNNSASNGTQHV